MELLGEMDKETLKLGETDAEALTAGFSTISCKQSCGPSERLGEIDGLTLKLGEIEGLTDWETL